MPRLPDFLIIGAAKSGTTSLFRWLGEHPDVFVPKTKEPAFFSDTEAWGKGISWYSALFAPAGSSQLTGEASVAYTSSSSGVIAAERIAEMLPEVSLIYLVRDPVERMRSHYRHEVQRSRESRPFEAAISEPGNAYVTTSLYFTRLTPYIERFPRSQIRVVSFERLISDSAAEWNELLSHLGLDSVHRPSVAHNVTREKSGFTPSMLWLWERGYFDRIPKPRPARRLGKRILLRDDPKYRDLLGQSQGPIPAELVALVTRDFGRLEKWLGRRLRAL